MPDGTKTLSPMDRLGSGLEAPPTIRAPKTGAKTRISAAALIQRSRLATGSRTMDLGPVRGPGRSRIRLARTAPKSLATSVPAGRVAALASTRPASIWAYRPECRPP